MNFTIMKKINFVKQSKLLPGLLVVVLIAFTFSCQKEKISTLSTYQASIQKQQLAVSSSVAENVALNFTKMGTFFSSARGNGSLKTVKVSSTTGYKQENLGKTITFSSANNKPAFYVITFKPKGFVIVSATKKESPVLAYSENSKFDKNNLRGGITDWISMRKKQIQYLESDSTYKAPSSVQEEWNALAPPTGGGGETIVSGPTVYEQVGPLLQTEWGQGEPFNDSLNYLDCYIPTLNDRALAGCDVIATAQVMRYWEYPSTYNWSIMPDTATQDNGSPGDSEVAILIKDVGAAIHEDYGCSESTSNLPNDRNGLVNTFGYSSDATVIGYDNTLSETETYLIPQLKNDWPVIMRGTDPNYGGHAWVCDGYQRAWYALIHNPGTYYADTTWTAGTYYLSMNWGWYGLFNGWFEYCVFNPDNYDFDSYQACIINIHP